MTATSPYRSLAPERRVALLTHLLKSSREARALYVQRIVAKGGGFRAVTLGSWPPDKLAKEIVRMKAENAQDELDLLQLLYVELEPDIQITFFDAAGVTHDMGKLPDDLELPYASADAVQRAAPVVKEKHGEDGMRYLRTIARYAGDAWPGINDAVTALEA